MNFARLLLCAPLLLLLAGCTAPATPQVAQLPSGSAAAAASSSTSSGAATGSSDARARPQLRLDDSDARVASLVDAYRSCLLDHGAARASGNDVAPAASAHHIGILLHDPIPAEALAACVSLNPRQPAELNAATNPNFHSESLAWVACLQKRGIWYTLTNGRDLTATYTPGHEVPDGLDVGAAEQTCTLQAFSGR